MMMKIMIILRKDDHRLQIQEHTKSHTTLNRPTGIGHAASSVFLSIFYLSLQKIIIKEYTHKMIFVFQNVSLVISP